MSLAAEVWIVDDMPADHALIKMAFADHVPKEIFRSFPNAEEALAALTAGDRPSLVLVDLKMPGMGGFGLLQARTQRKLERVPMLVLSSSADPEDVATAYDLGANAYVEKPKTMTEFRDFADTTVRFWFRWAHLPPS